MFGAAAARSRAWTVALAAIALACSGRAERPIDVVYEITHHLEHAQELDPEGAGLELGFQDLFFDRRPALYQPPPSRVRLPSVPAGRGAVLHVAPALTNTGGDGVHFAASCRDAAGNAVPLIDLDVSPAMARQWQDRAPSLSRCSAPTTEIELRTTCGPGDCESDWAVWGDPHVRSSESLAVTRPALVLLVSIDTLRADRLDLYGASRTVAPNLDALAADGIVFETAVAPSPWTIPSHASLLTATYPQRHVAHEPPGIAPALPTLAEVLSGAGWDTGGFVDSPFLTEHGFPRGFQRYEGGPLPGVPRRGARSMRAELLRWLAEPSPRPAFAFWHVMDVHGPYGARAPYGGRFRRTIGAETAYPPLSSLAELGAHAYLELERFRNVEDLIAAYDEGIAAADAEIGAALRFLRETGAYDDALIIVTSDHGETFCDHESWLGHGLFLYDEEIRVPLIVKLPGNRRAGERVRRLARLVDVAPTILDVAGVAAPTTFDGRALSRPPPREGEVAIGLSTNTGATYVRTDEWMYVSGWTAPLADVAPLHLFPAAGTALLPRIDTSEQLWKLDEDPRERNNRIAEPQWAAERERFRAVVSKMIEIETAARAERVPLATPPSPEQLEALQALGYLRDLPPVGEEPKPGS